MRASSVGATVASLACLTAMAVGCGAGNGDTPHGADAGMDGRVVLDLADLSSAPWSDVSLAAESSFAMDATAGDVIADATANDAVADGLVAEAAIRDSVAVEGASGDDMSADGAPPDAPSDAALPDGVPSDGASPDGASPNGDYTVMYVHRLIGSLTFSPMQVNSDGTGKSAVSALPTFRLSDIGVVNQNEHRLDGRDAHGAIQLPNRLGRIYRFESPSTTTVFLVRSDGGLVLLDSAPVPAGNTSALNSAVAMDKTGTLMAVLRRNKMVDLLRTDGTTFLGNSYSCDVTAATPIAGWVTPNTLTFAGQHLFWVGYDAVNTSKYYLFRSPTDCSAKAARVALPNVGSVEPTAISLSLVASEDGSTLALAAGNGIALDVMVVDVATGVAKNVSEKPSDYGLLALSPTGKYVAYRSGSNLVGHMQELYIRPTSKSAATIHLTGASNFGPTYTDIRAPSWLDDDNLVFWAGTSFQRLDLFHYRVSTGTLKNLTLTSGDATAPYGGTPAVVPACLWFFSRNGKYLYYVHGTASGLPSLKALSRTTAKLSDITPANVWISSCNLVTTPGSNNVFFATQTTNGGPGELYAFDQDAATPAVKLTTFGPSKGVIGSSRQFWPSYDGTRVAVQTWDTASSLRDLWVVRLGPTPVSTRLTFSSFPSLDTSSHSPRITADGQYIAYGVESLLGPTTSAVDLRFQSTSGGPVTILDSTLAYETDVLMIW